jgi:hypothetical protein
MELLDRILGVLKFDFFKEQINSPAWRGVGTHKRKSRTPYQGREHHYFPLNMKVEKFRDREARNERFSQLKASGTKNVSKFSDVEGGKSVWCVVKP